MRYFLFYAVFFIFLVLSFEAGRVVGFTEGVQLLEALPHD